MYIAADLRSSGKPMSTLAKTPLQPCRKDTPKLSAQEIQAALQELPDWQHLAMDTIDVLVRTFPFGSYAEAVHFTNQIAALADAADHHPAITLEWGKVSISWWTHTIGGLHHNDLVMAARCDEANAGQASH